MTKNPKANHLSSIKIAHYIAFVMAIFCWLLKSLNIIDHDFPALIVIGITVLSFLSIRVCKNALLCKNIFCAALFIPIFLSSLNTGGLYSFDFIGLIAIPIIAIILLNNKWGALWTLFLLAAVFYIFRLEYLAPESYMTQLEKFDLSYFMGISLFFFLSTIGLVMLLRHQVNKKQKALELKDGNLNEISEELERSRKRHSDLFNKANHDIKQPLRNIKSFAKLLSKNLEKEPTLSKENLEFLEYIIEGSDELSITVEELANSEI